jgi:signal transduction histidine kinase
MPEEKLQEVFEPFVRLERAGEQRGGNGNGHSHGSASSGAGLGLAICRSIIDLHKGRILALNRTDRSGLRVTFELPL